MPLINRDHPVGALIAWSEQARPFDHDALHLLRSVANLLAVLVQRRRTEEQLAHAQRLDALGQLTGGIAHDFNNLLTVVSGTLQLLELDTRDGPQARELIATALRSAARGAELTAKLLAFARRQRLLPRATDARALLRDVGLMLRRTLGNTVQLDITADHALSAAFVDPMQLEAALVNLALNARDAMPGGGTISIRARNLLVDAGRSSRELPVGHYIVVTVTDTGHGMSREVLARAMEPFFTTKESGRGSGLGLSMAYGFAKQSGGHLQIESAPGQGTRVALYLPATQASVPAAPSNGRELPRGGGETILVVEDDPAVRSICVAFLRSAAYEVQTAINATDALAVLQRTPGVALVFTDVMLGKGRDGMQLAAEIQRLRPGIRVLLTSGYEEQAAQDHAQFELLRKPYQRGQLLTAVGRLLDDAAREAAAT
jgi:signal transduction histidine kinase/ActR/RegA family two-component response regulator